MKFPDKAAVERWMAENPDRVIHCPPAIAYGIALDVVIPPDPDADKRVSDAFRNRAKQKPGWTGYWARKNAAPQTAAQNAKNGRARSQLNHDRKQHARTQAQADTVEKPAHAGKGAPAEA